MIDFRTLKITKEKLLIERESLKDAQDCGSKSVEMITSNMCFMYRTYTIEQQLWSSLQINLSITMTSNWTLLTRTHSGHGLHALD